MVSDARLHAPINRVDCRLKLLPSEPRSLSHWTPVRVHQAAVEVAGRVALLAENAIAPRDTGRVQLVLDKPIVATIGDRFIIRNTSGERTMGGGKNFDFAQSATSAPYPRPTCIFVGIGSSRPPRDGDQSAGHSTLFC